MFPIREAQSTDYTAIADIANRIRPEPMAADEILGDDQRCKEIPGGILHRLVATDDQGQVVGYGFAERMPWLPDGRWEVHATSHPEHRGQGIATALLQAAERIALEGGATSLGAWCRSSNPAYFEWAQRHGYENVLLRTESVLDLSTWDGSRFAGHVDRVKAGGIRLYTFEGSDAPEEIVRGIYDLEWTTGPDVPDWEAGTNVIPFEEWVQDWRNQTEPRFVALALDGDKVIGESTLHWTTKIRRCGYTGYTGVLREYRGRGIALACKLMTIDRALAADLPRLRTNNDFENPSMLAVNTKLGYQFVPGPRRLLKTW
jgi:GNAT superfamily N-acetyltransferase